MCIYIVEQGKPFVYCLRLYHRDDNCISCWTSTSSASYSHRYDASLMERLLFRVAKRWVAGYNADEAMDAALDTNSHGMSAILNFLGEDTTDTKLVDMTVKRIPVANGLDVCKKGAGVCVCQTYAAWPYN